jgi:hypothetical protein
MVFYVAPSFKATIDNESLKLVSACCILLNIPPNLLFYLFRAKILFYLYYLLPTFSVSSDFDVGGTKVLYTFYLVKWPFMYL